MAPFVLVSILDEIDSVVHIFVYYFLNEVNSIRRGLLPIKLQSLVVVILQVLEVFNRKLALAQRHHYVEHHPVPTFKHLFLGVLQKGRYQLV